MDLASLLAVLGKAIFVLNAGNRFLYANRAAEEFLGVSCAVLQNRRLEDFLSDDSPLLALVRQVRGREASLYEFDMALEGPRIPRALACVEVALLPEQPGRLLVSLEERTFARRLEDQLVHRHAAFSMTAMAAMLAHEVKNPLAGIRGAAQLLGETADENDKALTQLICEETDRIVALIDRMDSFSTDRPIEGKPVNIHEVLGHVRRLLEQEAAATIRFVEDYDPSLPPVLGERDLLIQVLLNLLKNATEALAGTLEPEITLRTRYRPGARLATAAGASSLDLPLVIEITDNGPGIAEGLRARLFDPFVTSKQGRPEPGAESGRGLERGLDSGLGRGLGRGLGLPLVAKLINDHGGIIEFESEPRRTVFRLRLPKADQELA